MNVCVSSVSRQSWSGDYRRPELWRPTWRKTPRNKLKTRWCRQSDVLFPREKTVIQRMRTIKEKKKQRHHGSPVLPRDARLERIKPVILLLDHTPPSNLCRERQGRNHTHPTLEKHQTLILNTFLLLRDYCVTKCTCTFQSVKLNSSSHLCQIDPSTFSSLILKMFRMLTRVTGERTFPVLFWVCGLDAEPPVCGVRGPAGQMCEERITRVEAGRHTAAAVSVRIYWCKKASCFCLDRHIGDPHASSPRGWGGRCSSVKSDLHSLLSFFLLQHPLRQATNLLCH